MATRGPALTKSDYSGPLFESWNKDCQFPSSFFYDDPSKFILKVLQNLLYVNHSYNGQHIRKISMNEKLG